MHSIHYLVYLDYELRAQRQGVTEICTSRNAHLKMLHLKIQLAQHLTHHQPMHHLWEQAKRNQCQAPRV